MFVKTSLALTVLGLLAACGGSLPAGTTRYGHFSSDIPGLTAAYGSTAAASLQQPCSSNSTGGQRAYRVSATTTDIGLVRSRISHVQECH